MKTNVWREGEWPPDTGDTGGKLLPLREKGIRDAIPPEKKFKAVFAVLPIGQCFRTTRQV